MSVRFVSRLNAAEKKLQRASEATAEALAAMLQDAVVKVSKQNPGKVVTGIVAGGEWFIRIDGDDRFEGFEFECPEVEETYSRFAHIVGTYGWEATPAPLKLEAQNGKLTLKTMDW